MVGVESLTLEPARNRDDVLAPLAESTDVGILPRINRPRRQSIRAAEEAVDELDHNWGRSVPGGAIGVGRAALAQLQKPSEALQKVEDEGELPLQEHRLDRGMVPKVRRGVRCRLR